VKIDDLYDLGVRGVLHVKMWIAGHLIRSGKSMNQIRKLTQEEVNKNYSASLAAKINRFQSVPFDINKGQIAMDKERFDLNSASMDVEVMCISFVPILMIHNS
jgi:hypothetical protein